MVVVLVVVLVVEVVVVLVVVVDVVVVEVVVVVDVLVVFGSGHVTVTGYTTSEPTIHGIPYTSNQRLSYQPSMDTVPTIHVYRTNNPSLKCPIGKTFAKCQIVKSASHD